MMRYEYRVKALPMTHQGTIVTESLEALLNEQGAEEFELMTVSVKDRLVFFQRNVYFERRDPEKIRRVLRAVKSYGDVSALSFVLTSPNPLSDGPLPPREVEEDEAWRFLIDRILGES